MADSGRGRTTAGRWLASATGALLVAGMIVVPASPASSASYNATARCDGVGGRQATVNALAGDSVVISLGGSINCTQVSSPFTDSSAGTWTSSQISSSGGAATFPATVTIDASPTLSSFTIRFNDGTFNNYFDVVVTLLQPPTPPSNMSGTTADGQTVLTWSPSGGSPTAYQVQQSTDGTNWSAVSSGTCAGNLNNNTGVNGCTVTGLTNGTAYYFRARGSNSAGDSAWSTASPAVTPSLPPPAPTGVSGTAGNAQVGVSWTAPNMAGYAAISGYLIEQSTDGINWSTAVSNTGSASTSYTVSSLTNGTAYSFRISGINAAGTGTASSPSSGTTPFTTPGMVNGAGISATTPSDNMLSVSWTAPPSNGAAIDGYDIQIADETIVNMPMPCGPSCWINIPMPQPDASTWRAASPGTCSVASSSTSTSCTVTGLTAGGKYYVKITAHNAAGNGTPGQSNSAFTAVGPPGVPSSVDDTPGNAQVALSWTAPSNGGSAITGYRVERNSGSGWVDDTTNTGSSATSYTVTGLTNGTSYQFRVSAINARGTGSASSPTGAVTPSTTPGQPAPPTAVRGDTQAMLTWSAPSSGGSAITGYRVEKDDGSGWVDDTTNTGSAVTSYTVSGLTNGTAYTFRVTAINVNGLGTASSASNSVTPVALPGTPTGLSGVHGNGQVALTWTPGSGGGSSLTGHLVELSSDGGVNWSTAIADTGSAAGSYTVTSLSNGTTYLFRVSGISSAGTGLPSSPSSGATPSTTPSAPTALNATVGDQQVGLSWTPGATGGAAITGYRIERNDGSGWVDDTTNTGSAATSYTVLGLTNGTAYTFRVSAINLNGSGAPVTASSSVTPIAPPGVPPAPTAVAGAGSATITVTAGSGGTPASFLVTASPGTATCTVSGASGSCTINGLTAGLSYTFTATATNANTTSGPSSPSNSVTPTSVTPPTPPTPVLPGPPASVTATAGPSSISVAWTPPVTAGSFPVTTYRASANPGGKTCMASGASTGCVITGLTSGTTYTVSVQALSGAGWSTATISDPVVVGVAAPSTPAAPSLLAGDARVTIVVSAPLSGATPTGYVATVSPGAATCTIVGDSGSCVVTGLMNGTSYTATVVATNAGGASEPSPASDPAIPEEPISPAPIPVPEPLAPGESALIEDGEPVVVEVAPDPEGTGLTVEGPGFDMRLNALGADGEPLDLGANGNLLLEADRSARSEGSGFRPSTDVTFTVETEAPGPAARGLVQGPLSLGTLPVSVEGDFAGIVKLPEELLPGDYVLQVSGVTLDNRPRSLFLGVTVVDEVASITLGAGTRTPAGRHDRIRVSGTTTGIDPGSTLVPYIKYAGSAGFVPGKVSITVRADGTFTWTRLVHRKRVMTAYVAYVDAQSREVTWQRIR